MPSMENYQKENRLTLNYVLLKLRELFDKFEKVELAVLFGSSGTCAK